MRNLLRVAALFSVGLAAMHGTAVIAETPPVGGFRGFAFGEGTAAHREWAEELIIDAVSRELIELGLTRMDEGADLLVRTHVLAGHHEAADLDDPDYLAFISGVKSVEPYDLAEATLMVDLERVADGARIWRAVSHASLRDSPKKDAKRIDRFIHKLFR